MVDEPLAPLSELRLSLGVSSEVVQFVRAVLEIEELFLSVKRVIDILRSAIGKAVPVILHAVTDAMFQVDILAPIRRFASQQREHALTVELGVGFYVSGIEKCR